jgi:hypothetical protein
VIRAPNGRARVPFVVDGHSRRADHRGFAVIPTACIRRMGGEDIRAKEGLKLVFGSVVVYVVMAACASGGPGTAGGSGSGSVAPGGGDAAGSSGGDGSGSSGGGSSSGGTALDDSGGRGILDALTDPVTEASAAPNQSGSRLKAKYYVGSDGSKTFTGMHDSMLNVDCNFIQASDSTTRCPGWAGGARGTRHSLFRSWVHDARIPNDPQGLRSANVRLSRHWRPDLRRVPISDFPGGDRILGRALHGYARELHGRTGRGCG